MKQKSETSSSEPSLNEVSEFESETAIFDLPEEYALACLSKHQPETALLKPCVPRPSSSFARWAYHHFCNDAEFVTDKYKVNEVFSCSPRLQQFWIAEHSSPPGSNGSAQFLVGQALNQSECFAADQVPDLELSKWNLLNAIQFSSMTKKQQDHQCKIMSFVVNMAVKAAMSLPGVS